MMKSILNVVVNNTSLLGDLALLLATYAREWYGSHSFVSRKNILRITKLLR